MILDELHVLQRGAGCVGQRHAVARLDAAVGTQDYTPTLQKAFALFSNNLIYLLAGFTLALFYGAGATFLIVYQASFFAAFVVNILEQWVNAFQLAGIALIHLIPESAGFIVTAIAGATISRALIHEKLKDQAFKNVLRNGLKMLTIGIFFIFIAAFLETYSTATLFHRLI